ncbi:MAG: phosphoglycerate kinase [Bacteroidia bacterium]|nr:phosphoglycerate kinase [Bacteroidia bacterium]
MGLDMYACAVPAEAVGNQQVDAVFKCEDKDITKLCYWRKFNHLHGWMEQLYREKGGKREQFNCDSVRLDLSDLEKLKRNLNTGLEYTPGFFFGDEEIYPEDIEKTKQFIKDAEEAIKNGKAVFYDSWW